MDSLNAFLRRLLDQAESAIDRVPGLVRTRPSGLAEVASFTFDESGWSVRVRIRNRVARGRGSRGYYVAQGDGATPEQALESFLERLPYFVQVTS